MPVFSAVRPSVVASFPSRQVEADRQVRGASLKACPAVATAGVDHSEDLQALMDELQHAKQTLQLICAADVGLKSGDDAALFKLGFSAAHVADLRSKGDNGRQGYPRYAIRNARWQVNWLQKRLASAQAALPR